MDTGTSYSTDHDYYDDRGIDRHYEYEFNHDSSRYESAYGKTPFLDQGRQERLRALREKYKLEALPGPGVTASPPPEPENDDNAKVARHQEELAGQQAAGRVRRVRPVRHLPGLHSRRDTPVMKILPNDFITVRVTRRPATTWS